MGTSGPGAHASRLSASVRAQAQALVRISESLAKMRLSAEVTVQDVQEALRLFRVSTMAAASAGSTAGDLGSLRPEAQKEVRRAEDFLKRRMAVRSTVNRKKVGRDGCEIARCTLVLHRHGCLEQSYPLKGISGCNTGTLPSECVNGSHVGIQLASRACDRFRSCNIRRELTEWTMRSSSLPRVIPQGGGGGDGAGASRRSGRASDRHHGGTGRGPGEEPRLPSPPNAIDEGSGYGWMDGRKGAARRRGDSIGRRILPFAASPNVNAGRRTTAPINPASLVSSPAPWSRCASRVSAKDHGGVVWDIFWGSVQARASKTIRPVRCWWAARRRTCEGARGQPCRQN